MAGRPSERARQAAPAVCAAMAQMPVVTTCRQVVDHLAVCTQTTGWADIERGVTLLQEALRSVDRLAVADATAILSMLNGSEIKGEARRDIAGIVNSKVSLTSNIRASSRDGDRQKCQQCPTWQNYLTQRMWDQMVDPKVSWDQVLRGIVARCDELGLTNPSEKTMLRMWVTYLACRIPPRVYQPGFARRGAAHEGRHCERALHLQDAREAPAPRPAAQVPVRPDRFADAEPAGVAGSLLRQRTRGEPRGPPDSGLGCREAPMPHHAYDSQGGQSRGAVVDEEPSVRAVSGAPAVISAGGVVPQSVGPQLSSALGPAERPAGRAAPRRGAASGP